MNNSISAPPLAPAIATRSSLLPDAAAAPELFEGVLWRRSAAFVIDAAILAVINLAVLTVVLVLGVFTAGLAWFLLGLVFPTVALAYYALTLGVRGATPGMDAMGIEVLLTDGTPLSKTQAMAHALLFYVTAVLLTPLVLLVGIFNARRRLVHDVVIGSVAVNAAVRRLVMLSHGAGR
jgi:uncharacterized RDD family membrane protein YckC